MRKYIFISGGVISGVGKGITAASLAFLLKSYGFRVTMLKADPYLNVDAGTMNPIEHGETFVLEDGLETDMDLGHYERFSGETFASVNYMTLGSVMQSVLKRERALEYHGSCVQIYKHLPEEILNRIKHVGVVADADIVIIEIGGTVGEYEAELFLEANRILKFQEPENIAHINVSYLPIPAKLGEMKTKPTQIAIRTLNRWVNPDFVFGRAALPLDNVRKGKISYFCNIPKDHVISAPDVDNIYEIPVNFERENVTKKVLDVLGVKGRRKSMYRKWEKKVMKIKSLKKIVRIGIVAKYYKSGKFNLKDSYVSVLEAVNHACWENSIKPEYKWFVSDEMEKVAEGAKRVEKISGVADMVARKVATLSADVETTGKTDELLSMDGIIVPQGWGSRGVEGKIQAVRIARENKIPYLGLCFGMQMAVIEYARNVLGLVYANSEEVDVDSDNLVVHLMKEQKKNLKQKNFGGTIRLGAWPCEIKEDTLLAKLYEKYGTGELVFSSKHRVVQERHRHRYEFNNEYKEVLQEAGLVISGMSPDGVLVEAIELPQSVHPFFVGTQYHPELKSRFLTPHPIFMGFIDAAVKKV